MGRRKKKEKDVMDDLDYSFGDKKEQKTVGKSFSFFHEKQFISKISHLVIGIGKRNPNEGRKRTGKRKKNRSQNN